MYKIVLKELSSASSEYDTYIISHNETRIGISYLNNIQEIEKILFLKGIKLEYNRRIDIDKDLYNILKKYFYL